MHFCKEITFVHGMFYKILVMVGYSIYILTLTLLWVWWGRCEKKLSPKGGRVEKKSTHIAPAERLEPGTCGVLGEGPQLHAMGVV